jgi:uncharacterized membrane protein
MFMDTVHPITLFLSILIVIMNGTFYFLLKVPTLEGRKLMDEIAGFRLYLFTAERYRLNQLTPEKTPRLFEKYLPYAIALDVENAWGEQFSKSIEASGGEPHPYQPNWYKTKTPYNIATFPLVLSSNLNTALSSTASSSSASGGSGWSGGGRGGGGGGGW